LKKKILKSCKKIYTNEVRLIGGTEKYIQIDEAAFRRNMLVTNPTSEAENNRTTAWIIGAIEENINEIENENNNRAKFFMEIKSNRNTETILNILLEHVANGTKIKSDGWSSYVSAIRISNEVY
jgi:hypothetical protein